MYVYTPSRVLQFLKRSMCIYTSLEECSDGDSEFAAPVTVLEILQLPHQI